MQNCGTSELRVPASYSLTAHSNRVFSSNQSLPCWETEFLRQTEGGRNGLEGSLTPLQRQGLAKNSANLGLIAKNREISVSVGMPCTASSSQLYAARGIRRFMPTAELCRMVLGRTRRLRVLAGWSSGRRPGSIRHSLASYSASRKASRRSLGWKRVRLRCSYGLSFARAASLSARWACR